MKAEYSSSRPISKHCAYAVLGGLILFYFFGNLLWSLRLPGRYFPVTRGEAIHFLSAVTSYNDHFRTFYQPPVIPLITAGLLSLDKSRAMGLYALYVNLFFFAAALFFVYKIAEYLKSREAGVLAAVFFALYPIVFGLSRLYGHSDFPVMAAMAFNGFALLKTGSFRNTKWSLAYGVSLGLGIMTKETFCIFFAGPFVVAAVSALTKERSLKTAGNLAAIVIIGVLIAMPYYGSPGTVQQYALEWYNEPEVPWYAFHNIRVFTVGLSDELLSPPFFVLFIAGLIGFLAASRPGRRDKALMLAWFLLPWVLMIVMPHKKRTMFSVPYVPAIAVISAVGCAALRLPFKKIVIGGAIALGAVQYLDFSYGWGPGLYAADRPEYKVHYFNFYPDDEMVFRVDGLRERYTRVFDALHDRLRQMPEGSRIFVSAEMNDYIDPAMLDAIGYLNGLPLITADNDIFTNDWIRYGLLADDAPAAVFYVGRHEFGDDAYLADQYRNAVSVATVHPFLRDDYLKQLDRFGPETARKQLRTFRKRLTKETVLFRKGDLKGVLISP